MSYSDDDLADLRALASARADQMLAATFADQEIMEVWGDLFGCVDNLVSLHLERGVDYPQTISNIVGALAARLYTGDIS